MLFILTGQIQSGKTRWLLSLLDEVRELGVLPFGVVAPGVWRRERDVVPVRSHISCGSECDFSPADVQVSGGFECEEVHELANVCSHLNNKVSDEQILLRAFSEDDEQVFDGMSANCATAFRDTRAQALQQLMPHGRVDENGLEKLGICNVLFPQERALLFAQRHDIALARGLIDDNSQSERAKLGWYMSNDAIEEVNRQFARAVQIGVLECAQECSSANKCSDTLPEQAFLVVDELGRMELMCDSGLTSAMQLLRDGAQAGCEHALVVVREQLLDLAHEQLGDAWGGCLDIRPDAEGKRRVLEAVGNV